MTHRKEATQTPDGFTPMSDELQSRASIMAHEVISSRWSSEQMIEMAGMIQELTAVVFEHQATMRHLATPERLEQAELRAQLEMWKAREKRWRENSLAQSSERARKSVADFKRDFGGAR